MELSPMLMVAIAILFYAFSSIQILAEYERGVIFRLGKLLPQPKGPGVILVLRPIDRIVRMSLRTIVLDVPPWYPPRRAITCAFSVNSRACSTAISFASLPELVM